MKLRRVITCLVLSLYIVNLFSLSVAALSQAQTDVFNLGIHYFNTEANGATSACSSSQLPASNTNSASPVYVVGDSLSVGMKGADLEKKLATAGLQTSQIEANTGFSVPQSIPLVKKDSAKVVAAKTIVVELGTNDGGSTGYMAEADFAKRITDMVTAIKTINQSAQLYWMNAYKDGSSTAYVEINKAIAAEAPLQGYKVIDWHTEAGTNNSKYAPFDPAMHLHPEQHYSELADFVVGSLSTARGTTGTSGSCCTTTLSGTDNEARIFNYLVTNGFEPWQAAGIMGNMAHESGFIPERQENIYDRLVPAENFPDPAGGPGWGIVQWTPGTKIIDTFSPKSDANDLSNQLNFLRTQLDGTNSISEKQAGDDIKNTKEVINATVAFQGTPYPGGTVTYEGVNYGPYFGFERPGDKQKTIDERIRTAIDILGKYGSGGNAAGTGLSCSTSGGATGLPPSGDAITLCTQVSQLVQQGKISFAHDNDKAGLTVGYVVREQGGGTAAEDQVGAHVNIDPQVCRAMIYLSSKVSSFRVSSMVGTHSYCTSSSTAGNCTPSRHWTGHAFDVDLIERQLVSSPSGKASTTKMMVALDSLIGGNLVPDQVICEGNGRRDPEIERYEINNSVLAPAFYQVGDHMNHIHIGY